MNLPQVNLEQTTIPELIDYILRRYHEPLPGQVMRIGQQLQLLAARPSEHQANFQLLGKLVRELWAELEPHLLKEERVLFPMIQAVYASLASGRPAMPPPMQLVSGPIRVMKMEHERADEILAALDEATSHYEVSTVTDPGLRALYAELQTLDVELREHIRLENERVFQAMVDLSGAR